MSDGHNAWYRLEVRDQVTAVVSQGSKVDGASTSCQQKQAVKRVEDVNAGLMHRHDDCAPAVCDVAHCPDHGCRCARIQP